MKTNKIIAIILVCTLLACSLVVAALVYQPPPQTQADIAAPPPPPMPQAPEPEDEPEEEAVQEPRTGVIIASMTETPSVAPARHTALVGHFKNIMTHNGLFRVHDNDLTPVPDLVRDWAALSDTEFEFVLHEGIRFHNGQELTAYDVAASLEYVRTFPYQTAVHLSIDSWEVIDRHTILIDTGTPTAMLFNDLAHHGNFIMPRSLIESGHNFALAPIGSGPFVFENWTRGDSLDFSAFAHYFDRSRAPMIEYVHWRIMPEGASRTIALETGEVDYIVDVAFPDIPRLQSNPNITVMERPGATFSYFIMNNDRPQFENIYVRRAIDMALNRDAMLSASLNDFGVSVWSTMPPMFEGSSQEGTRQFDPAGARALLAENNIDPRTLAFDMLAFDEAQRRRAEVAQANLADIGIPTTITMIDFSAWLTLTLGDNFEASFANFTANNLVGFMRNLMTIDFIDTQNRSRMRNEELSGLIEEAFSTVDEGARNAILHEASRMANEHIGFIGTNMNTVIRAFNSTLTVPELAANGFMFMNMMHWAE
ncbi:MAG: ABC transporter substrate-binding protein [Defluviitaleaceae bacterium]|nr:ABC transporter substrate-binding protein [Defluviitaleaceae bacterium]